MMVWRGGSLKNVYKLVRVLVCATAATQTLMPTTGASRTARAHTFFILFYVFFVLFLSCELLPVDLSLNAANLYVRTQFFPPPPQFLKIFF